MPPRNTTARPVADTIEDLEFLAATGAGTHEAAQRLGFPTTGALERWLRNHHDGDLYRRLAAHQQPLHTEAGFDRTIFYTRRRCPS